ncbi:hypothetical protein SDRG_07642 [Saprolegnia diclina VS20]|uniref:TRAF-type domain-containing protein n=1 Tax=Saprolegnia diclina (strain VS20) TaxID=1156394 RepID=T0RQH5_SAPDV|nr:hypothetical protein SDRG_07642 [Saprolegnia diclina VS20]EQC34838.1 hypothetical protein SDRG_07642 [Saprolegnia diclina VS20]|eukprot:XP_008611710.1 hypothetical protein SDRG_07642 [Saprolegnia diclina VS20]
MGRLKVQKRLEDALRRHDMQLVIWMIDSGEVPVDVEANGGDTPLLHAVAYNQIDVLDLLLDRGVNVNAANRHGKTALMKAAATTDVDTTDAVNILLRRGANIFAKDPSGKTALDWARRTNNVHVGRRLELAVQAHIVAHRVTHANQEAAAQHDAIAQMNDALTTQLHALLSPYAPHEVLALVTSAAVSHDMYSAAFPNGPPFFVNAESAQGWTALTKAASVDDVEGLRCLLQHGAMVDYESKLRHTALTWASYSGHTNAVQLLLQHRARVEYMTREKMTALSHASRNGKAHVVAILLSKYRERFLPQSSQPDYVSNEASEWHTHFLHHVLAEDVVGKSAMAYATAGGHTDVVALLQGACDQARAHETHVTTLQAKTRVVACALGCGTENAHDLIGYHEAHKCPRRDVACEKCKEHMQSQHLAEHEKRTCAYRDVTCVNLQFGCAAVLPWRTMQLHQSEHCHYRPVECRLECGKVLQWQARPQHEVVQPHQ